MAPKRSSQFHPLSLTQRQCQMLLMLGAPVYLPRPRLWTWVTLHKFSIGLLLTFPWPYCHIVELTPRIHLCDYVCQVVPRDSLSAQRARAQVFLERTMKKKSTSTMSTLLWIFIACASKNLDVFELFSGTGKIHAQARLNLRNWLLLWMLMAPILCNVRPVQIPRQSCFPHTLRQGQPAKVLASNFWHHYAVHFHVQMDSQKNPLPDPSTFHPIYVFDLFFACGLCWVTTTTGSADRVQTT